MITEHHFVKIIQVHNSPNPPPPPVLIGLKSFDLLSSLVKPEILDITFKMIKYQEK